MNCDAWIAIDTETSGLGSDAQVLEVAVVHFWKGKVVRRWSSLVCPVGLSWDDEKVKQALSVNKLSMEALMYGAPSFKKVRESLELEVSEPVWVAHVAEFDMRQLRQEYERLDLKMPQPEYLFCTKEWDMLIDPSGQGHKLEQLCERWEVTNSSAHRAFGDAEACGTIFGKMLEKLPKELDELAQMYSKKETLEWRNAIRG